MSQQDPQTLQRRMIGLTNRARATAIAEKTADAYSYDRYATWRGCALLLVLRGFNDREVEAILRSKLMRWAGDRIQDNKSCRYGRIPARAITEYLDDMEKRRAGSVKREVAELVAGTFNGEGE